MWVSAIPLSLPRAPTRAAVFGQSYQLAGQNAYDTDFYRTAGLATDDSDFVGGLYLQASELSRLFRPVAFRPRHARNQAHRSWLAPPITVPVQLQVNYAKVTSRAGPRSRSATTRNRVAGVLAMTTDWSLLGNIRYDLETDQTITDGLGVRYQDDCFTARPDLSAVLHPRSGHQAR